MPIQIESEQDVVLDQRELVDENGEPTAEAQILEAFLDGVDFSPIFDMPELQDHIEEVAGYVREVDGELELCEKDDDGAEEATLDFISGEDLADVIDEEDLYGMFAYWANHLPEESLEERTWASVALSMLDEGDVLDEKKKTYKPGYFKKAVRSKATRATAVRQLKAMFYKGVYKYKGKKQAPEYKRRGTAAGQRAYRTMMNKATGKKKHRKNVLAGVGQRKLGGGKARTRTQAIKMLAKAKKGAQPRSKAKAKRMRSLQAGIDKIKTGLYASRDEQPANLSEGARLASGVVKVMADRYNPVTEAAK
jgi:hypothetical protein